VSARVIKRGLAEADNFTFIGLLSSVVEAPLTALFGHVDGTTGQRIGGLFNVKILGTDMTAFFTAMISLCFVIAVIRIVLKFVAG